MASEIGIYGLGTMGRNLAVNFAQKQIPVSVFNRTTEVTKEFISSLSQDHLKFICGCFSLEEFLASLKLPRKIVLLVKDSAIDQVLEQLSSQLATEDTVIDMGNTFFKETISRSRRFNQFQLVDCGISGGEEGARQGPSLMLGGNKELALKLLPTLQKISAQYCGEPCVDHFGSLGSGHFIKMLHNGMEYAIMQFISEIYVILKHSNTNPVDVFHELSSSALKSYLNDITLEILKFDQNSPILDKIKPQAKQKGTGKWTSLISFELDSPAPFITSSVESRLISCLAEDKHMSKEHKNIGTVDSATIELAYRLFLGALYDQSIRLMIAANNAYGFELAAVKAFKVWRAGSILAANHLEILVDSNIEDPLLEVAPSSIASFFLPNLDQQLKAVEELISNALKIRAFCPVLSWTYNYTVAVLFQQESFSLIQAQRDYFGRHGVIFKGQTAPTNIEWRKNS